MHRATESAANALKRCALCCTYGTHLQLQVGRRDARAWERLGSLWRDDACLERLDAVAHRHDLVDAVALVELAVQQRQHRAVVLFGGRDGAGDDGALQRLVRHAGVRVAVHPGPQLLDVLLRRLVRGEEVARQAHTLRGLLLVRLAADGGPLAVADLLDRGEELSVLAAVLRGEAEVLEVREARRARDAVLNLCRDAVVLAQHGAELARVADDDEDACMIASVRQLQKRKQERFNHKVS